MVAFRIGFVAILLSAFAMPGHAAQATKCPADAVRVGPTCVDRYEASVWQIPATATALVRSEPGR